MPTTETKPFGSRFSMAQPNADAYIAGDVVAGEGWRWTGRKPRLQFYLDRVSGLRFYLDYAIHSDTLRHTGPVTLTVSLNNEVLDRVRHEKDGYQRFERPVPPRMLRENGVNFAAIEIDKVWTSPEDGVQLGFVLGGAGFLP